METIKHFKTLPTVVKQIILDYYYSLVFSTKFKMSLDCFRILPLDIEHVQGYLRKNKFLNTDLARIGNNIYTVTSRHEKKLIINQVFEFYIDKHWGWDSGSFRIVSEKKT